jgi:hypothetical protein
VNEGSIRTKGVFSFINKSNKNKVIQNSPAAYSKKASKRFGKRKSVCGRKTCLTKGRARGERGMLYRG